MPDQVTRLKLEILMGWRNATLQLTRDEQTRWDVADYHETFRKIYAQPGAG